MIAVTRDRTRDLQIFSLTLSQLSYPGTWKDYFYLIEITPACFTLSVYLLSLRLFQCGAMA